MAGPRANGQQDRLTRVETLLEGLPTAIENAIKNALRDYTERTDHEALLRRVEAAEALIRELTARNSFAAGAVKVEERVRSQAQEWARTLTPLVFGVGATIVGSIWALQAGAG